MHYKMLDDAAYAKALVARETRKRHGPLRIRETLRNHGIDDAAADNALAQAGCSDADSRLRQALSALEKIRKKTDTADAGKLTRYLFNRGFDHDTIRKVIRTDDDHE